MAALDQLRPLVGMKQPARRWRFRAPPGTGDAAAVFFPGLRPGRGIRRGL